MLCHTTDRGRSGTPRIVIVGGSLGGLRSAQRLRREGFTGEVVIVEAEQDAPYDRPPLSKAALAGRTSLSELKLRVPAVCEDVIWKRGERAVAADLDAGSITLASGEELPFDGLVVATGLRPRRLTIPGPVVGRHVLRTKADAVALRTALLRSDRAVIIGAGFIGCEVAATARELGRAVTIVAPETAPLEPALGPLVGRAVRRLHERHGVSMRLGAQVAGFGGEDRVRSVNLASGERLETSVVVEAVGSAPNVEWLRTSGLDVANGIACDAQLRAGGRENVAAVGDIARFPLALLHGSSQRIEHWNMAGETARQAAAVLSRSLGTWGSKAERPFSPLPSFWSDQYGVRLQSFGLPAAGLADIRVLDGTHKEPRVVGYYDEHGLVGVLGIGVPVGDLAEHRAELTTRGNCRN